MKKLLLSAFLGLAALGLGAAPSQAGTFGLIPWHCVPGGWKHCCGCKHHCSDCCCPPYNAFSPACCPVSLDLSQLCCNNNQGCGYPGVAAGPACGYLPDCGAPAGPAAPCTPAAPSATNGSGATSQAAPYVAPVPGSGGYGYAPTLPPTVLPMGGQPFYPTAYGR